MKRSFQPILWALGLVTAMVLFSCQKQEDETIPVLKVPQAMVSADGGSQSLEVAATSSWTLSVDYGASSLPAWITLAQTSGSAGVFRVQMTVSPNNSDNPRTATLVLSGPTLQTKKQISQMSSSGGGAVAKAPLWMELPALDNPDLYFFTHDWNGGQYISKSSSPKRSWSFYWDPKNYVSHWVAYPLNKDLKKGSYGRYDSHGGGFPKDPILTDLGMKQPDLWSSSYGGGWTRGHQIPSADRQENEAVNMCTYYVTNMTPQQYDFNGGIWANLESRVRSYSNNADTLYVVTGCHITTDSGWSGKNGGVAARVPSAYYKAMLRLKGGSYSAAAYYLPHSKDIASDNYANYAISVSELEKKVGVDFFATLPAVVGKDKAAEIESANPSTVVSKW
ncbi:MAG: DNA/RNA non-specific endonuclease [Bacteroidales bacterium]|nr:DNA/RNA non-specific endonuclease [Bacteroidales bacterium]